MNKKIFVFVFGILLIGIFAQMSLAKNFNITSNGNDLFFVNGSSGNIGIGTSSPSYNLEVNGTSEADIIRFSERFIMTGKGGFQEGNINSNNILLFANSGIELNTEGSAVDDLAMYISTGGNVGIGTDSPDYKLHVNTTGYTDSITIENEEVGETFSAATFRMLNDQGGDGAYFSLWSSDNAGNANLNNELYVKNSVGGMKWVANTGETIGFGIGTTINDANDLVIDSTGYVGLGTTSPDAELHVVGDSFPTSVFERTTTNTNSVNSGFSLRTTTSGQMSDGFGGGFVFQLEDADGTANNVARISARRYGADDEASLAFEAGGLSTKMIIRGDGNVGIGTTSPSDKLDVAGNVNAYNYLINGSSIASEISGEVNSTSWNRSGTDVYLANSGDNVGIGTDSPSANLELSTNESTSAQLRISGGNNNPEAVSELFLREYHGTDYGFKVGYNSSSNNFYLNSVNGASEDNRLVIERDSGDVGIGTTDPNTNLHVSENVSGANVVLFRNEADIAQVSFNTPSSNVAQFKAGGGDELQLSVDSTDNQGIRIDTSGNVGIGTISPSYKLEVDAAAGDAFGILNGSRGLVITAPFGNVDPINFTTNNAFNFIVDSVVDLAIDSNGNVGIGTENPQEILHVQVNSNRSYNESTSYGEGVFISNFDDGNVNGTFSSLRFQTTSSEGSRNAQGVINLIQPFYTEHGSEFAFQLRNDAGDLFEAMRLDSIGNVGIGTSSPSYNLEINGSESSTIALSRPDVPSWKSVWNYTGGTVEFGTMNDDDVELIHTGNLIATIKSNSFEIFSGNDFNADSGTFFVNGSSDKVGIGTTDPNYLFEVNGEVNLSHILYVDNSDKRIGIGTDNPGYPLHVNGSAWITGDYSGSGDTDLYLGSKSNGDAFVELRTFESTDDFEIYMPRANADYKFNRGSISSGEQTGIGIDLSYEYGTSISLYGNETDNDTTFIHFDTNSNSYFNGGNVGIGTSSPVESLHIQAASNTDGELAIVAGEENQSAILYLGTPYLGDADNGLKAAIIAEGQADYGISKLHFSLDNTQSNSRTVDASLSNIKMTIDSTGNVGIGISNPSYKLDVNGSAQFSGGNLTLGESGTPGVLRIYEDDTNDYLEFYGTGNNEWTFTTRGTSGDATLIFDATDSGSFTTSFDGDVGIGTTTPVTSPDSVGGISGEIVQIGDNSAPVELRLAGPNAREVSSRISFDNSGSGDGMSIIFNSNAGGDNGDDGLLFWNDNNNKSDMKINRDNGYVGIGTTIPDSRLEVNGDVNLNDTLYVHTSGSVGIGDSTPSYKLDVTGDARITTDLSVNDDVIITDDLTVGGVTYIGDFADIRMNSLSSSTIISSNDAYLAQNPVAGQVWHDLLAFDRAYTTQFEQYNGSWSNATLDKGLFAHKEDQQIEVADGSTITAARWTWTNTAWSNAPWMLIGHTYVSGGATKNILIESSSDGSSWTVRHNSTSYANAIPQWYYIESYSGDSYLRLTITSTDGGAVRLSSIRLLTDRWGDQGNGIEFEYPYYWDEDMNIGIGIDNPDTTLEVNGVIKTTPRSSATCDSNSEGGIYYDSDDNHFYGCNGSSWVQLDN